MTADLRIEETLDQELLRYVRTAKLVQDDTTTFLTTLAELREARLISMTPQAFTLSRLERVDGAEYAQAWLIGSP